MEPQALNIQSRPPKGLSTTDTEPKALGIVSKPKDYPQALNIVSTPKVVTQTTDKKFDLSFEYLKSKVPITSFIYSQIKPILEKVERTNQNRQDTDVLDFGKKLQEMISHKSIEMNDTNGYETLNNVRISHEIIVECVECTSKRSFLNNVTDKLFGKTIKQNDVFNIITEEVKKNREYRKSIADLLQKYPRFEQQLESLSIEMDVYIQVAQLLIEEFTNEGFIGNVDLVNRRITSLIQSKAILNTTIGVIIMHEQKLGLYAENIDNVVNILVPTLLTKMTLKDYANDVEFQQISEQIVSKLRV